MCVIRMKICELDSSLFIYLFQFNIRPNTTFSIQRTGSCLKKQFRQSLQRCRKEMALHSCIPFSIVNILGEILNNSMLWSLKNRLHRSAHSTRIGINFKKSLWAYIAFLGEIHTKVRLLCNIKKRATRIETFLRMLKSWCRMNYVKIQKKTTSARIKEDDHLW